MKIVFFTHPSFLQSQSMPRFANMLIEGMRERGNDIIVWTAKPYFYRLIVPDFVKKWMGYLDQYILFPFFVKKQLRRTPEDTLFVFADQALGPWIPLVKDRPHVVHCHDFLAQRSALGEIPQNPTSWTGKKYQAYIRNGYRQGKNFISVSHKTQEDLYQFLVEKPNLSVVVYNGMNKPVHSINGFYARTKISELINIPLSNGYLLHVGGNQWYKNRQGVIDLYAAWRSQYGQNIPLLLIGSDPSSNLKDAWERSFYQNDIHFLTGKNDDFVQLAYAGASLFLFPSLAEGFGWPIAEAMAAGCLVVTTNEAPMTEVGNDIAFYIEKQPNSAEAQSDWLAKSVNKINDILTIDEQIHNELIEAGKKYVTKKFSTAKALDTIQRVYYQALQSELVSK